MARVRFDEGAMWEEGPWCIETDRQCYRMSGGKPCRHSGEEVDEKWIQPAVVIANNEGGYNSTGVCLDCIIEAAEKLRTPRGVWVEFAEDGKKVVDILHEPKDADMPDSYVWCEESRE